MRDFRGHGASFDKAKAKKRGMKSCVPYAGNGSQLQTLEVVGSVFSRDGYRTSSKELQRIFAHSDVSCTTKDSLILNNLGTHVSPDVVHTFTGLVRALCREWSVSLGDS